MSKQANNQALLSHPPWDSLGVLELAIASCRTIIAAVIGRRLRRALERELARLDDRLLRDIGLNRAQITSALDHIERQRDRVLGSHPL